MLKRKIRVLIVDDSVLLRSVLGDLLSSDPDIEVVGQVADGKLALPRIRELKPDVITLDVEMPLMDGVTTLKVIMEEMPTPVVMVSSVTYAGGSKALEALSAGAFDFVCKPRGQSVSAVRSLKEEIISKVKAAFQAGVRKSPAPLLERSIQTPLSIPKREERWGIVAIGISTGGPPCVESILCNAQPGCPPIVVVQHMPKGYTKAMADRINNRSKIEVVEASNGLVLRPGLGVIAPGGSQMEVVGNPGSAVIRVTNAPPVSGHAPSVDVLFQSLTKTFAKHTMAILMTGMGRDGATGLKLLKDRGAFTVVQDEASSTVYGMPKIGFQEGAHVEEWSLNQIITRVGTLISSQARAA